VSHQQRFDPIFRRIIKCLEKQHTFYHDRLWQVWDWEYEEEELTDEVTGLDGQRALVPQEKLCEAETESPVIL